MNNRVILEGPQMQLTIKRLCYQLRELHGDFSQSCLVGIQRTGVPLAERLRSQLQALLGIEHIAMGKLDVTFYRDDFRTRSTPIAASPTEMNFLVEDKRVILVDDVLYTGRTIRAAMSALLHYGRPAQIELLSLIDRRFNRSLPIQPDYVGRSIDTIDEAYVRVDWEAQEGQGEVLLLPKK